MDLAELVVSLTMDTVNFVKGAQSAVKELDNIKAGTETVGGLVGGLGAIGAAGFGAFAGAAGIAVAGVTGITTALTDFAKDAAFLPTIEEGFNKISVSAGKSGETMLKELTAASGGMISAKDMMTNFNQAAMLISPTIATELPQAMEMLQKVSMSTGTSMEYLMNSLVVGVGRASPRILDNMGVQIKATEAYDAYAQSIGRTADSLNKQEQSVAIWKMTLAKLEENTKAIPPVQDSAAAAIQRFQATIENTKNEMGAAFLPTLSNILSTLTDLATSIMPLVVPMVEAFGGALTTVFDALKPLLGLITPFAEKLAIVIDSLSGGDAAAAMAIFSGALKDMAIGLGEMLPGMLTFGADLITNLVQGIADSIPALMPVALTIMTSILDNMLISLPKMVETGLDIILNLIDGLIQALPILVKKVPMIIIKVYETVIDNLPRIIDAGLELILVLSQAIIDNLPEIALATLELVLLLITTIVEKFPEIVAKGVEIVGKIVLGLGNALFTIAPAAWAIITKFVTSLVEKFPEIMTKGKEMVNKVYEGLSGQWETFKTNVSGLFNGIKDLITKAITGLGEIGKGIIDGIWEGITGAWGGFISGVKDKFGNFITGVKNVLKERSPSQVFAEIGANVGEGFKNGVRDSIEGSEDLFDAALLGSTLIDVVTALQAMVGPAFGIGLNAALGIASGIVAGTSAAVGAAEALASAVTSALSISWGINSPSKVFAGIGLNVDKGSEIGLTKSIGYDFTANATQTGVTGGIREDGITQEFLLEQLVSMIRALPDNIGKSVRDSILLA